MRSWIKIVLIAATLLALGGAAAAWLLRPGNGQAAGFATAPVTRGSLRITIAATGTVEPEEVVDVGAQVAGQIVSFGTDTAGKPIDYGSAVTAGMVLARIDDTQYVAADQEAAAQLESADAGVQRAEADLEQMRAKLYQAQRDWERAQKLGPSEALAEATYDAYRSAYEVAKANVRVSDAAIVQANAAVVQARAAKVRAERNLAYCTISSPVKGVIIDRRVNKGQTVVASLNAPSLFLIAKDLTRMQVWVAVNEADIGKIHEGQPVSFTVDAFPDETFTGEVAKVRLNASMTQNVVTYTVVVSTDNRSGRLLPYLTANVQFELSRRDDVLLVPAAALRWQPTAEQVAPEFREPAAEPKPEPAAAPREAAPQAASRPSSRPASGDNAQYSRGVVWVAEGQYVRPIAVRVGLSDGLHTEVAGKDLAEGLRVVTGLRSPQAAASEGSEDTTNPFAPKFPRRQRNNSSGSGSGSGRSNSGGEPPPPPPM